jgi:hypothetical protein
VATLVVVLSDAKMTLASDGVATQLGDVGHDPMSTRDSWDAALAPLVAVGL